MEDFSKMKSPLEAGKIVQEACNKSLTIEDFNQNIINSGLKPVEAMAFFISDFWLRNELGRKLTQTIEEHSNR